MPNVSRTKAALKERLAKQIERDKDKPPRKTSVMPFRMGKPRVFEDEKSLEKCFYEYVDYCIKIRHPITVLSWLVYANLARATWQEYCSSTYPATCLKIRQFLESDLIACGLNNEYNPKIVELLLQNAFGYAAKSEVRATNENHIVIKNEEDRRLVYEIYAQLALEARKEKEQDG